MAITEAQRKAHDKYFNKAYKQVKLSMPKQEADDLDRYCYERNLTKAGFIRDAIKEKMERDKSTVPQLENITLNEDDIIPPGMPSEKSERWKRQQKLMEDAVDISYETIDA